MTCCKIIRNSTIKTRRISKVQVLVLKPEAKITLTADAYIVKLKTE
jgi:hypothetical protein